MSRAIVIGKIASIIFIFVIAYFTLGLTVVTESNSEIVELDIYNLNFNSEQTAVILEQPNEFWGAYWQIPNTYLLNLTTDREISLGVVVFTDLYQEEIDQAFETGEFYTFEEMADFVDADSTELNLDPGEITSVEIDYQNGIDFFYIVLFAFEINQETNVIADISVTVNSALPFPEITYVILVLLILTMGFMFTPKEATGGIKKLIKKHGLDAVAGTVLVLNFVSNRLFDSLFVYLMQVLLLFISIHKANILENMLRLKLNHGQRLFSSVYITSLLTYSTTIEFHLNVASDVKAVRFLSYLGVDVIQPVYWVVFFLFFSQIFKSYQQQHYQDTQGLYPFITRSVFSATIIVVFEYAFQFFSLMMTTFELLVDQNLGNFLLQVIEIAWYLYFGRKAVARLRKEEGKENWLGIIQPPDFQDVVFGLSEFKGLLFVFYGSYLILQWGDHLLLTYLFILQGDISRIVLFGAFVVLLYFAWSLTIKQVKPDEKAQVTAATSSAFLVAALGYELSLFLYTWIFPLFGDLVSAIAGSTIVLLSIFLTVRRYKTILSTEGSLEREINKPFLGAIVLLAVVNTVSFPLYVIFVLYLLPYILIPGYLIVMVGQLLLGIHKGNVTHLYTSSMQILTHILVVIGFIVYILLDPLGIGIALTFFGAFMILYHLVRSYMSKISIEEARNDDNNAFDLSSGNMSPIHLIAILVLYFSYFALYIQQGANFGIDDPFHYTIFINGNFLIILVLLVLYHVSHRNDKPEIVYYRPRTGGTSQTQPSMSYSRPPTQNRFCRNCGTQLGQDVKFCTSCGQKVT